MRLGVILPVHELREAVRCIGLPEKIGGELRQASKARLALAQRRLGALALEELADLAADHARGGEQPRVRLAQLRAAEAQHADRAAFRHGGESEGAAHAGGLGERLLAHARVGARIRAPGGGPALQHLAEEAFAGAVGQLA